MADGMLRPPIARGMQTLDRTLFRRATPLKAARVLHNTDISKIRSQLQNSKDILRHEKLASIVSDPDEELARAGKKCILLRPETQCNCAGTIANANAGIDVEDAKAFPSSEASWPHSHAVHELVRQNLISVVPYTLNMDYTHWTYHDIICSILPLDNQVEVPSGFSQVGHVAHLNLRSHFLPYKQVIAEVLMDKNPSVKTVINKIDDVGEESEYRTFRYEVLAGPDDLNVTVSEENCIYRFDYSKVYWNTRLHTEHARLVATFKEGEAVCDVMAGIGPFAVPAGKKEVFVWANDLNPDSYICLKDAIMRNKVDNYVRPFCMDGARFICEATKALLNTAYVVEERESVKRSQSQATANVIRTNRQPKIFQHFILNLPASALTFLSSFVGLYSASLREAVPPGSAMPLIHVYCFSTKDELVDKHGEVDAPHKICHEISKQLGYEMSPGKVEVIGGVEIYDVRDVAPNKRMYCASFRLPEPVAFRDVDG